MDTTNATHTVRMSTYLICIYIFLTPLDMILNLTGSGTVLKYIGMLLVGVIMLETIGLRKKLKLQIFMVFVFLYWAHYAMGIFWSIAPATTFFAVISMGNLIALLFVLSIRDYTKTEFKLMKIASIASALFLSFQMMLSSSDVVFGRGSIGINGVYVDPNDLSAAFIIPWIVSLDYILKNNTKKSTKGILLIGFFIMGYGLLLTGSRGGLLAIITSTLVFMTLNSKLSIKKKLWGMLVGSTLSILLYKLVFEFLPRDVKMRLSIDAVTQSGGSGRTEIISNALSYFSSLEPLHLLVGNGLSTFTTVYESQFFITMASHNLFLQTLLDGGVIGLILVFMMFSYFSWYAIKTKNWLGLAILLGTIVMSFGIETWNKKFLWNAMFFTVITVIPNKTNKSYATKEGDKIDSLETFK